MIKLTLNPQQNPIVRNFNKKLITIGAQKESILPDFVLPDSELESVHVKIIEENKHFYAINAANDPFVALNEFPFGKKQLKNKDLLQIGTYSILFELEDASIVSENKATLPTVQQNSLEVKKDLQNDDPKPAPADLKIETKKPILASGQVIASEQNFPQPSKDLSIRFEPILAPFQIEAKTETLPSSETKEAFIEEKPQEIDSVTASLSKNSTEFEVGEFDDESETWAMEKEDKASSEMKEEISWNINWKMVIVFFLSTIIIASLTATIIYFNMSSKNADEELQAAESIADIAMALKYAQIHHIKPTKKNWSDPEFINKTLAQVIPHDYPSEVNIDPQGHLNGTSYSLRIYTSTDFSQFLVIAQPAPRVLQWLIPKTAIVIDSKLMQLRKVSDMKTLNRLLVNSNNLDNSNAIEVTNLVKKGDLIPLNDLAYKRQTQEFSPPKALALLRPGAENYIYNAPRYYQLGATIMKHAIDLMELPGSVYEMSRLKQDMSLLSKMQDMVLYSADGIQLTLDAQKAIAAFVSNARFLTAYLKFDSQGKIINSHLMMDDERSYRPEEKSKTAPILSENNLVKTETTVSEVELDPVLTHPLFKQLSAACAERQDALTPLKNQITELLNTDLSKPMDGFELYLASLVDEYIHTDLQQKQKLAKNIHHLSDEYRFMSLQEFTDYLNKAGLEDNRAVLKHAVEDKNQSEQLQTFMDALKVAENFFEIEEIVNTANHWLIVKNFTDLNQLQLSKKMIKIEAIARINKLLFSYMPTPLTLQYNQEQRLNLQHILKLLIADSEEQAYYLEEFDHLMKKN